MDKFFKKSVWFLMLLIISVASYAQKDVTQFLGIPVEGSKSEMIQKLKAKGFTINSHDNDVLDGEFNGTDVHIVIVTNNNKVRRIAVADANTISEGDVRIRFNNLLQQFQNNKKYLSKSDSAMIKYTIPEDEDISYELSVKNKRYQAFFYQKTAVYDSLEKQMMNETDIEKIGKLGAKQIDELDNCINRKVWISIGELSGGYYITIFYDNVYNEANGEGL